MRIQSSTLNLTGTSVSAQSYKKSETLQQWVDKGLDDQALSGSGISFGQDIFEQSEQGKVAQNKTSQLENSEESELDINDRDQQKLLLLQKMVESLTGKKFRFIIPKKIRFSNADLSALERIKNQEVSSGRSKQGWGIAFDSHSEYREYEEMSFSAKGSVRTADGRAIDIGLELKMSREFASFHDVSLRAGDAVKVDPLVINLSNSAAALTEKKFAFDLDNDGQSEQISFLKSGSGFIALDKNGDGTINNGSELFGPASGDGFADLAAYDSDKNNWIDENDPIYDKLRIWTKDESGKDVLFALGQQGIGALFLGSVSTRFELNTMNNRHDGQISKTGIFLSENGTAGTLQHVDLVV